ncbi:uncharacterized protein LY89DRAFT_731825 [Mollisia scopiformis]|uniref:2EXR domain-containing protein n=1 Tax=Mollisia scopiformis TaxID=149040 RepID=A0A194XGY5_MOLSC|nr:uncharacterized protein LY89DRAFT_731825 [Mollisia scopiformis]KUJ19428.1 hypothetical protein LY89DRAFT_731825 [Mollisia scopiformis]
MARTKQCARKNPGDWAYRPGWNCYEKRPHQPTTTSGPSSTQTEALIPSNPFSASNSTIPIPDLSRFRTLPFEIRTSIWEAFACLQRIVTIHAITDRGLRAPIPPILHVCAESRAVGSKHYTLSFGFRGSTDFNDVSERWDDHPALEAKVYFNFERDVLYFGREWNEGIVGQWSCANHLKRLVNGEDMKKVERIGFDVDVSVCCQLAGRNHGPWLVPWTGLKKVYLGLRDPLPAAESLSYLRSSKPDWKREGLLEALGPDLYEEFVKRYRGVGIWLEVPEELSGEEAVEFIRTRLGRVYGTQHGAFHVQHGEEDFHDMFTTALVVRK